MKRDTQIEQSQDQCGMRACLVDDTYVMMKACDVMWIGCTGGVWEVVHICGAEDVFSEARGERSGVGAVTSQRESKHSQYTKKDELPPHAHHYSLLSLTHTNTQTPHTFSISLGPSCSLERVTVEPLATNLSKCASVLTGT